MSRMDFLRQGGTPFDRFLYAALGEDRGGNTVSVLSALARLGLDPWDEAADLATLTREGARNRLEALLARFGDVPALGRDHGVIIPRLVDLLPDASGRQAGRSAAPSDGARARAHTATGAGTLPKVTSFALRLGPIIAILLIVLFLVQTFVTGTTNFGE